MHIGVDVDGVLRKFLSSVRREFVKDHPDLESEIITVEDVKYWDIRKLAKTDELGLGQRIEDFALSDPDGSYRCFRNADPIEGEVEAMKRLYHDANFRGHIVSICTSQKNPWQKEATVGWLHEHEVPFDNVILADSEKGNFGLDAIFDDRVKNCVSVKQNGGVGVLKQMDYNEDDFSPSANSIEQFKNHIL